MTKQYTLEQLLAMNNQELDEAVALAQGWSETACFGSHTGFNDVWFDDKNKKQVCKIFDYHPTANTPEGKAQAWDLMVNLISQHNWSLVKTPYGFAIDDDNGIWVVDNKDPQVAVVIASILVAQEGEK